MAPLSETKHIGIGSILVFSLILSLLGGAILVRLVGDTTAAGFVGSTDASKDAPALQNRSTDTGSSALRGGNSAPDFALTDLDGQSVRLDDHLGKPVLINFWATWCGPCAIEMPTIEAAYRAHQQDGLVVLAVAVDDRVDNVRHFFDEHELTIQPLLDDGNVSRVYQVFGLPTSFFIGQDGEMVASHTGLLTKDLIEEYLAQIQARHKEK